MSNALAIAAVTTTLRHLLQQRFDTESAGGITVTTRPLDRVRDTDASGGDRAIVAQLRSTVTDRLEFRAAGVTPGEYFLRLRIDGVDSLLVDRTVTPPVFDRNQKVVIL